MTAPRQRLPLILIVATVLLDSIGFGIVIPVFPRLVTELTSTTLSEAAPIAGWIGMSYALMQFVFGPIMGGLSDRFGRRPVLLACLAAFAVDYLIAAFAPNIWWLLAARLVAGITGASFTVAYAYLADITDPQDRAARFGLLGVAFGLGFIIGPAVGGLVADQGNHAPFLLSAALAAINGVLAFFFLPESLSPDRRRPFDIRRSNPVGAVRQLGRLGRTLGWLALGLFAWFIAHQSLQSLWNFYAAYRYDWGPREVGLSLTAVGVGSVLVQGLLIRRAVARYGERATAQVGMLCAIAAFLLYGLAWTPWIGFVGIVFGAFGGLAYPSIQSLMTRMVGADEQGELQGSLASLNSLSVIVGPPLMTHLFGWFSGPGAGAYLPGMPYYVAAALALFTLVMFRRALSRMPAEQFAG